MKRGTGVVLICAVLIGCQTTTGSETISNDGPRQLATQGDLSAILGRTLTLNKGQTVIIDGDGELNGLWNGEVIAGTYQMRDGFFCRTLTAGPRGPSPEDCQILKLNGNNLEVIRDRGNGASLTYTIS